MKLKQLFLTLLALFGSINVYAADLDFSSNGLWYKFMDFGDYSFVMVGTGSRDYLNSNAPNNVIIPSTITIDSNDYPWNQYYDKRWPVTRINRNAFYNCYNIKSIEIPASINAIYENAFCMCTGLNKLYISDLNAWMNIYFENEWCNPLAMCAFGENGEVYLNGSLLTQIDIPSTTTEIKDYVFEGFTSITQVTIPSTVTKIGSHAFLGCSITSIEIPESVVSIGERAFEAKHLTSVTVNANNPLGINENCFSNRVNATLYVPAGSKAAYEAAPYWQDFAEIIEMEAPPSNIAFADSNVKALCVANWDTNDDGELSEAEAAAVTDLGEVFRGNTSITSFDELQYFTGLTEINDYAFRECGNLTSITLPESIISIGGEAFYYCNNLNSIRIPASVTSIGGDAFVYCWNLNKAEFASIEKLCGINFAMNSNPLIYAKHLYIDEEEITDLIIPHEVTNIPIQAFCNCQSLASVTIPNSVTSIGESAFRDCHGLASIIVETENSIYDSRENCNAIIETSSNTLVVGCQNTIIPNNVTSIGARAFDGCSNLTSITIPESVTSIGGHAFECCGLTSITIPESVTSIGEFAFWACANLTSITIPKSVTSIGSYAFDRCRSMTTVTSEIEEPFVFGSYAFDEIASTCTLTVPYGTRDAYLAAGWTEEIFKGGIVEAAAPSPSIAFADANVKALCVANWDTNGDNELSEAEAAAVTDLGEVFRENTTITSFNELQYFTGLTEINDYAFRNTIALTSVIIPENVTRIGKGSFGQVVDIGASNLVSVQLPDGLTEIDEDAFWECNKLKNINFPTSLRTIGECAFHNTAIESLILPEGFLSLGYSACNFCSFLKSIYIPSTVTSIGEYAFSSCNALHSIVVSEDNTVYDSRENCNALIKTETNKLIRGGNQTIIPLGICSIGDYAFDGLSNLYYVTIPKTVTSIGDGAFQNCNELLSVKVDIVEPHHITQYTFSDSWGRTYAGSATLYVPAGCKAAYEAADYWKDFKRIIEFVEGDVNGDEEVDVLDVVDIARYVVGTPAETFVPILADINYNGEVNVGDAVALVNEIAGDQNFVKPWRAPQQNSVAGDVLTLISTDNGMSLCVENERNYTAFQFDLFLPAGTDVTDLKLNALRKQGHQLIYNKVEEGHYRVAAISTSNRTFSGYEGELLAVGLEGIANEDICLRDIRFFTTDGEEHLFDDIVMQSGTATDIASPQQPSNGDEAIYNLAGQRIQKMRKGINIINGKKIAF